MPETYLLMPGGQNTCHGQTQRLWELIIQRCGYWEVWFTRYTIYVTTYNSPQSDPSDSHPSICKTHPCPNKTPVLNSSSHNSDFEIHDVMIYIRPRYGAGSVDASLFDLEICELKRCATGFPGGAVVKNQPANSGDTGLSPDLGRSHMPRSN